MKEHVDVNKLIAEIERRYHKAVDESKYMNSAKFVRNELENLREFAYSLHQEKPEVDLEKEIDDYIEPIQPWEVQEAPFTSLENCARHFYELGKNARRGE